MSTPEPDRRWPRSVYARGAEPDPRFSLANERTFLAWIRTTLALLAGSAAAHLVDLGLQSWLEALLSSFLALVGLGCALYAWSSWSRTERALRVGGPLPSNASGAVLVVSVVLAGLVLVVVGVRG